MNHEATVLGQVSRILDEVANLHDEVRKPLPSFVRGIVDNLATKSAEGVRTIVREAQRLLDQLTESMKGHDREYLSAGLALQPFL